MRQTARICIEIKPQTTHLAGKLLEAGEMSLSETLVEIPILTALRVLCLQA